MPRSKTEMFDCPREVFEIIRARCDPIVWAMIRKEAGLFEIVASCYLQGFYDARTRAVDTPNVDLGAGI